MGKRRVQSWIPAIPIILVAVLCTFMSVTSLIRGAGEDGTTFDKLLGLVVWAALAVAFAALSAYIARVDSGRGGSGD